MNIDVSLSDEEVKYEKFRPITYFKLPRLFTGIIIKNRFEEKLLKSGRKDTEDIAHLCAFDGTISPVCLRGIFTDPSDITKSIFSSINSIDNINYNSIYQQYAKILNEHNLSCNNTYSYLMDGLYPIDSIHYETIVADPKKYIKIRDTLLDKQNIPWYFNPEIKIFILTKCNTYIIQNTN